MKRMIPFLLLLILPAALFAQSQQTAENKMLKQFGLDDTKIAQVMDIQSKTMAAVRQDAVHLQLLRAQLAQALLPAKPDMTAVNDLIGQEAQTRTDIQKTVVGARVQLRQIMGDDNFRVYAWHLRTMFGNRLRGRGQGFMMKGGMRSGGSAMSGAQPGA